jgi:anaerobic selenocysteine-containing dehydrogenase
MASRPSPLGHEHVVETACPLDCPDSCSLSVTIKDGRVTKVDGSNAAPVTGGYICAKVRRFPERLYGDARLRYPMVRTGPKGSGQFTRTTWDEALQAIVQAVRTVRERWGAEAILPFSYGGSNGLVSQDTTDARLFRRLGASRLARTVCAAPTGAANKALYGKMPSVTYEDYVHAKLIVLWGVNPSTSGIHLVPFIREAQHAGATLVVVDPRSTPLARQADLHLAVKPGTDLVVALALHRHLLETGLADTDFLSRHTRGIERLRERAAEWTFERAADTAGIEQAELARFADLYARTTPAVVRCGWGLERNRNGGSAALAILALPAVGGKFGVRGGGYSMSNSGAWQIEPGWIGADEPATREVNMNHLGRSLLELDNPPVKMLFVYNCNPAVTMPDQNRVLEGLAREDLFTVVFDQVMTDTAQFGDILLPATTFLEAYDVARAYGPINLQLVCPAVDAVGEARPNADVFGELCGLLDLTRPGEAEGELDTVVQVIDGMPGTVGPQLRDHARAVPPCGTTPIQFVDVLPRTADGKVDLFPEVLDAEAAGGLYRYRPDPGSAQFPLALISPASDRTISSTLGELPRPETHLLMHPDDAVARALEENAIVAVFNELGEVRCPVSIAPSVRPGTAVLPKGLWRHATRNGSTANALAPDSLTDFGGGACFNDARVEVRAVSS